MTDSESASSMLKIAKLIQRVQSKSAKSAILNLSTTDKDSVSSTWNWKSMAWNPESKSVLDSLAWGDSQVKR